MALLIALTSTQFYLAQKLNRKDTDSASEILFTTKLLFHEEVVERKVLFCGSVPQTNKQTKLAVSLLKY